MKLVLVLFFFIAASNAHATSLEDRVKAAYLLNFMRFTEWPQEVFSSGNSPLNVCVLSTKAFLGIFQKTVSLEKNSSRKIEVKAIKDPQEALQNCHAVYIGYPYSKMSKELNNSLMQKSILTIADEASFYKQGGIISFVTYKETVQFNINLKVATEAKLKLSSRMVSLAKQIKNDGKD